MTNPRLLPAAPLLDYIASLGHHPATAYHISIHTGFSPGTIGQAINRGHLTIWLADRIANAYGVHPAEIYGDAWLELADLRGLRINRAFTALNNH